MRWLISLATTIGLVAGVPMLLLTAPSPLDPDRGVASLVRALLDDRQIFDEAVASVFVGLCWLLWLAFVVGFIIEMVAAIRGRASRRVAGIGLGQAVARRLISALMWTSTLGSVATSVLGSGALTIVTETAASAQVAAPIPDAEADHSSDLRSEVGPRVVTGAAIGAGLGSPQQGPQVALNLETVDTARATVIDNSPGSGQGKLLRVVQPGLTMWDLATEHLGDPLRWVELSRLNLDQPQPDGLAPITDPDQIQPGHVLVFPPDAVGFGSVTPASEISVWVQDQVAVDRPDASPQGIGDFGAAQAARNANSVSIPREPLSTPKSGPGVAAQPHLVVLSSDVGLWDLAQLAYGDGDQWKTIADANSDSTGAIQAAKAGHSIVLPGTVDIAAVSAVGQVQTPAEIIAAGAGQGSRAENSETHGLSAQGDGLQGESGSIAQTNPDVSHSVEADVSRGAQAEPAPEGDPRVETGMDTGDRAAIDVTRTVEPGDSLWSIAKDVLVDRGGSDADQTQIAEYWVEVVEANTDLASGDVDLIYPGEQVVVPQGARANEPIIDSPEPAAPGGPTPLQPLDQDAPGGLQHSDELAGESAGDRAHGRGQESEPSSQVATEPEHYDADQIDVDQVERDPTDADQVEGDATDAAPTDTEPTDTEPTDTDLSAAEESVETATQVPESEVPEPGDEPAHGADRAVTSGRQTGVEGDTNRSQGSPRGEAAETDEPSRSSTPVAAYSLVALGAATLAAGVIGALRRRRSLQRRVRTPGRIPAFSSEDASAFEVDLAHAAEVVEQSPLADWTALSTSAIEAVRSAGPVEMRVTPSGDVHASPVHPEPGWDSAPVPNDLDHESTLERGPSDDAVRTAERDPSGRPVIDLRHPPSIREIAEQLRLDPDIVESAVADVESDTAVAPTAVVIGTDPRTGDGVFLDVESSRQISLEGQSAELRRFARSVVLDLCVSDRAHDLQVIAVGIAPELADLERVQIVEHLSEAVEAAIACGHCGTDSQTPIVIVVASEAAVTADSESLESLVDLNAAVIAPGQAQAPVRLSIADGQVQIMPSGGPVQLAAFEDSQYLAIAELIEVTGADASQPAASRPSIEQELDIAAVQARTVEPGVVEVKVLGPVEIAGAKPFSSLKASDVLAYLAFHRQGVDADQIKTWVWPTFEPPSAKAFANVLSRARTALGADPEGRPHLSRAGADRLYRLAQTVTTDFDRFRAYVSQADEATDPRLELDALQHGLELVRGVPFSGGTASSYTWADNHVRAHVEFVVDEAAHRCADLALGLGDIAAAREAAFKGLQVVPGCEQCFRRRFMVAAADNNRSELRRAMIDLERTVAAELGEPEAIDMISSEVLDLFHELDESLHSGRPTRSQVGDQ